MPKSYSDNEKEQIVAALKEAAREALEHTGVQKTSVDSLVSRVHIPKGTFYLFYPSKEMLFFDVFLDEHNEVQQELLDSLAASDGQLGKDDFAALVLRMYHRVNGSFLFNLMTGGEMELVVRKLPSATIGEHLALDDFSMERLFAHIPQASNKDAAVFSAAFRAIFLLGLHKNEIGAAVFDRTIELFVKALVDQLFAE